MSKSPLLGKGSRPDAALYSFFVIPAKAGIQRFEWAFLDAGFRRHDDNGLNQTMVKTLFV